MRGRDPANLEVILEQFNWAAGLLLRRVGTCPCSCDYPGGMGPDGKFRGCYKEPWSRRIPTRIHFAIRASRKITERSWKLQNQH